MLLISVYWKYGINKKKFFRVFLNYDSDWKFEQWKCKKILAWTNPQTFCSPTKTQRKRTIECKANSNRNWTPLLPFLLFRFFFLLNLVIHKLMEFHVTQLVSKYLWFFEKIEKTLYTQMQLIIDLLKLEWIILVLLMFLMNHCNKIRLFPVRDVSELEFIIFSQESDNFLLENVDLVLTR